MAKKLDAMPAQRPRGGAPIKYPWAQWFDGSVWELAYGEDFDNPNLISMAAAIRSAATKRNLVASVYRTGEKTLVMRALRQVE